MSKSQRITLDHQTHTSTMTIADRRLIDLVMLDVATRMALLALRCGR
jgi:hypothetical protein